MLEIMPIEQEPEPEVPLASGSLGRRSRSQSNLERYDNHRACGLDTLDNFSQAAHDPREVDSECC